MSDLTTVRWDLRALSWFEARRSWARSVLISGEKKAQRFVARVVAQPDAPIAHGLFIFYLALLLLVLVPVVGALRNWRIGSGKGNVFVDVLSHVAWVSFNVLAVTWIVLLVIWISRWFSGRRSENPD